MLHKRSVELFIIHYSLLIINYPLLITANEEDAEFVEGVDGKRDEE